MGKDFTVGGAAPAAPTSAPAASTESAAPSPPTPSGNRGRVIAVDVMKAAQEKPASTEKSSAIATPAKPVTLSGDRTYEDIPVSAMREIIGKRLSESMFTSPHFYVTMECLMDSLMASRAEINAGEEI